MSIFCGFLLMSLVGLIAAQCEPAPSPPAPAPATGAAQLAELKLKGNFEVLYNKYKRQCKCAGQTCLCCFPVPVTGFRICYSHTQIVGDRSVNLKFVVEGLTVVDEDFLISPKIQKCGTLPAKFLSLNACLTTASDPVGDKFKSCTSFGLQAGPGALSGISVSCFLMSNTDVTIGGRTQVAGPQVFKSWANTEFAPTVAKLMAKAKALK